MILLDTNALSELAREPPDPAVVRSASDTPASQFGTSAICEAEILLGIAILAPGRRRNDLFRVMGSILRTVVGGRVLPFDRDAARAYAELASRRRRFGKPVAVTDLQIAATAVARSLDAIATRNTSDFMECGIRLIDPWAA